MQASRPRHLLAVAGLLAATGVAVLAVRRRHEPARSIDHETARVRDLYEREAARYDSMVRIPERLLFADGRIWAAAQATGDVLEIAAGTGRNLPHYRCEAHLWWRCRRRLVPKFLEAGLPAVQGFVCSMKKKRWAQRGSTAANPYFGKSMATCGTPIKTNESRSEPLTQERPTPCPLAAATRAEIDAGLSVQVTAEPEHVRWTDGNS